MERRESTANERLLAKLKDKGISQRKFAAMIGMSTNGFHAIAKGETNKGSNTRTLSRKYKSSKYRKN